MRDLNREDLIVLGLEWSINDAELRRYFEQFGEVAEAEVSGLVKYIASNLSVTSH